MSPEQFHLNTAGGFPPLTEHIKVTIKPVIIPPGGVCCILGKSLGESEIDLREHASL